MPERNIALGLLGLLGLVICKAGTPSVVHLVLLGMFVGPFVGLTSTAPYFSASFKAGLACGLLLCGAMVLLGWRYRAHLGGQALVVVGVAAWAICGLVAFGPV